MDQAKHQPLKKQIYFKPTAIIIFYNTTNLSHVYHYYDKINRFYELPLDARRKQKPHDISNTNYALHCRVKSPYNDNFYSY